MIRLTWLAVLILISGFLIYLVALGLAASADSSTRSEGDINGAGEAATAITQAANREASATPSGVPTRGGLTIDQWRRSANYHARQVRTLRRANRQRIRMDGANGVARGLLCIHSFEGSWTDPNPPHWGGLQMDTGFQGTYGGEFLRALGTADRWPAFVQLAVGMRAYYSGRGFGPWPNTRRMCGI